MFANLILIHIYKKKFLVFSAVSSAFAFKVGKKCQYEQKKLFSEMQNGCKKTQNLMLIMNQLEKSHAKKVINVTKNRVFDFL